MTASFERIEELFHELADLTADARAARLAEIEASEGAEVAASVRRLLVRDDEAEPTEPGAAASPVAGPLAAALHEPDDLAAGTTVGHYRLLRELGRGGMGVVYEADQLEPVKRRVAFKVVGSLFAGRRMLERFEAERQTLARMTHPNIAQVYDAGQTPSGRPYVVMELVEGEPITELCDRLELDAEGRIRLFLEVCDAAQHAHQKGIIHRDLKPSNVLAREVDGPGRAKLTVQAKVIDFGIAKALAGEEQAGTAAGVTHAGEVLGTPDYMSPEQRERGAADVDTRTDVYALGVLLYELLTGRLPFAGDDERAASGDTPSRPSTRFDETSRRGSTETDELARRRAATPAALERLLKGDLDWIVLRALEPERDRRYPSVSALVEDLERFLRHEPVSAGPPGAAYRVRKFVRRHRAGVAAAAFALLALVAGTVAATVGLLRARAAEREARVEADTADRVTDFLVDLFQVSDPQQADGREISVREVLEEGSQRIRTELAGEPEVQARLLRTAGLVYNGLGLYDEARPMLEEAATLQRALPESDDLANSLIELSRLHRRLDELERAEEAAREAVAVRERLPETSPSALASALNELALVVRRRDPEEALAIYRRSLALNVEANGEDNGNVGVLLANIGAIQARAGEYDEAKEAFERALPLVERHLGADDPRAAGIYGNLSFVYRKLGRFRRALELAERDLELTRNALGDEHPTIALILTNLSALASRVGEREASLRHAERAVSIARQRLPSGHRLRLVALNAVSTAQLRLGHLDAAREALDALLDEVGAGDDQEVAATEIRSLVQLSEVDRLAGDPLGAAETAERALAQPLTADDPQLESAARWALAHARLALGDVEGAETARDAAVAAQESSPGVGDADRLHARARWQTAVGDVASALDLFEQALAAGYSDAYALHDPVLEPLRRSPRWPELERALRETD